MMKTLEDRPRMCNDVIEAAVAHLQQDQTIPQTAPPAEAVVAALIEAERQSKKDKQRYRYEQLTGAWRLGFVSGTAKVKPRPGATPVKRPGKGRYLPKLTKIQITYCPDSRVENAVTIGPLRLCLTGPTRFWPTTNALAFDFTHVRVSVGRLKLYEGDVRGGAESEQLFNAQTLKDQAFFTFFAVGDGYIAARGKGGGLALWTRSKLPKAAEDG